MAQLNQPYGVFVSNGEVFICDTFNHRVRKVLRNGQIVTICGTGFPGYNGDGQLATHAQLNVPYSVVVSSSNQVYISDNAKEVNPCSIYIHHDELYFSNGYQLCKLGSHGNVETIAGIANERGFNGDDMVATE